MSVADAALVILRTRYKDLPQSRRGFGKSLCDQHAKKGSLSDKQWGWVVRLAGMITGRVSPVQPVDVKVVKVGDFQKVYALLAKAALGKLKYPKLTFEVGGEAMVLYPAGPKSSAPGVLNLVRRDPNRWYGRLSVDGTWTSYGRMSETLRRPTWDFINRLGKNPVEVLAECGRLAGRCCYCTRPLCDEKSTSAGYGPVCAKRWGLPWGKKTKHEHPFDGAVGAEMKELGV